MLPICSDHFYLITWVFFLIINETKNLWHHIRHLFFNHHFCACNNRTSTMQLLPFYVFFCSFQAVVEVVSKTRKLIKISYTQQPRTEVVSKQWVERRDILSIGGPKEKEFWTKVISMIIKKEFLFESITYLIIYLFWFQISNRNNSANQNVKSKYMMDCAIPSDDFKGKKA